MKVALIHDAIFTKAGGERVLLNIHKSFPEATIYTSIYDSKKSYKKFLDAKIKTTWLNRIAKNEKTYKLLFFPLGIIAARSINLKGYDVVFATTTHAAKYIKVEKKTLVINYCFTPFRLAWNPNSYKIYSESKGIIKFILDMIIYLLKKIDFHFAQRANHYIAMNDETRKRIKNCYKFSKEIEIIKPSIDTSKFYVSHNKQDYYLIVSRLEKYKKVDLAINTFNKLGKKLKIVGNGVEKNNLKKIAQKNIEFLSNISDEDLRELYANAKGFIFPQHEDYGLTPLEAYASGTPVIAFNGGGVKGTGIPYEDNESNFTMLLFNKQNINSLTNAILKFEKLNYNASFIRNHALKFDDKIFIKKIKKYVSNKYDLHKK